TEEHFGGAIQAVLAEGLDNYFVAGIALDTQKGDAEGPGSQDSARLVALEGERLAVLRIEGAGAKQGSERLGPIAPFQGRAVRVVVCLGPFPVIANQPCDFVKVVLRGVELTDQDLELPQAVQQCGEPSLLLAGDIPIPLDQLLDLLALGIATNSETVARPDEDLVQAVALLQRQDTIVEVRQDLSLLLLFELQVQHASTLIGRTGQSRDAGERGCEPPPVLRRTGGCEPPRCFAGRGVHTPVRHFHFLSAATFDNPKAQPIVAVAGRCGWIPSKKPGLSTRNKRLWGEA